MWKKKGIINYFRVSGNFAFILFLLFIITGASIFQRKDQDRPYFFIQITDPQFGMFTNNEDFVKETDLYEKVVMKINRLNPDFVVITGDFVHDPEDILQINEFKRITSKIDSGIPVYLTPGNHDIGRVDRENIITYIKRYGYDRFSIDHKNSRFIGFNSCIIKANSPLLEDLQFEWLEKQLTECKNARQIILFCHHPFFIKSFDEPETYSNIGIQKREKYLALFALHQVDAVFSGHLHNNSIANYGNIQLVITSAVGKPLGDAPSGIRIVKIYNDRFEHEYYALDEVPDTILFDQLNSEIYNIKYESAPKSFCQRTVGKRSSTKSISTNRSEAELDEVNVFICLSSE